MKYLENAIKFLLKNWMLALPLFVLAAVAALVSGAGASMTQLSKIAGSFSDPTMLADPSAMISAISAALPAAMGGGFLAFIFQFVTIPASYGLVNRSLETGNSSINDIGQAVSQNFVKYVLYFVGALVLGLGIAIASFIIILVLSLLTAVLKGLGVFIVVIVLLALAVSIVAFMVLLSFWLSAMIVDGIDVVGAAKRSIEIAKSSFWMIIGISLLVNIGGAIAGSIIGFLRVIPLIGPIIASIIPSAVTFVMIIFYLMVYREKTGRMNMI